MNNSNSFSNMAMLIGSLLVVFLLTTSSSPIDAFFGTTKRSSTEARALQHTLRIASFPLKEVPEHSSSMTIDVELENPEQHRLAICFALRPAAESAARADESFAVQRNAPCGSVPMWSSVLSAPVRGNPPVQTSRIFDAERVALSERVYVESLRNLQDHGPQQLVVFVENHDLIQHANFVARVTIECESPFGVRVWTRRALRELRDAGEWFVGLLTGESVLLLRDLASVTRPFRWLAVSDTCLQGGAGYQRQLPALRDLARGFRDPYGLADRAVGVAESVFNMWFDGHMFLAAMIALNAALFVPFYGALRHNPYSVGLGARNWSLWRVFTSTFTHANPMHLILNMVALQQFGPDLHRAVDCNNIVLATIYVVSAFCSAALSAATNRHAVSVGASGAIYGIQAALMALQPNASWTGFVTYIALDSVSAFLTPNRAGTVDVFGHAGGAVAGYCLGWLYGHM